MASRHTTSAAFLEALAEAGVSYIFADLGQEVGRPIGDGHLTRTP
jgi:hypothetical protein